MARLPSDSLSRRERQIMDVLQRVPRATVAQVREGLASPPSYSTVRALLRILEEKGHVRHVSDGPRYVYEPVVSRSTQTKLALRHLVRTFFGGSTEQAVLALVEAADTRLTRDELEALARRIASARKEGR
jgi:predicted transcriptional regulator